MLGAARNFDSVIPAKRICAVYLAKVRFFAKLRAEVDFIRMCSRPLGNSFINLH